MGGSSRLASSTNSDLSRGRGPRGYNEGRESVGLPPLFCPGSGATQEHDVTVHLSRRALLKGASAVAMVSAGLPALAKAVPASDPFIERLIARMSIQDKA